MIGEISILSKYFPVPFNQMFSDIFSPIPWFKTEYSQSRESFQHQQKRCQTLGDTMSLSYTHPMLSPSKEPLATDVFWIGPKESNRVIVLISGTHGIEGYAGSAIQSFLLSLIGNGDLRLPQDTALLFIHALNPWGMAWHRRCDEKGIDINRNFIDFQSPLPSDPDYYLIRPWMFCTDQTLRTEALNQLSIRLGERRFEKALSGGQYEDPYAPFYGGRDSSISRNSIEDIIQRLQLPDRDLVVLDLHTGLGAWGYGELMCDHPMNSPQQYFAQDIFGAAVTMAGDGSSSSVPKLGLLDYAWHQVMNENSCFLTLEFGSYSTQRLFNTLIQDHCRWSPETDPLICHQQSKHDMLSHFCPDDICWQRSLLFQAWQTFQILFSHR